MNKIQKFIEDNDLDFTGSGSALNGNCCIIAGYSLHIGITNTTDLIKEMEPATGPEIWIGDTIRELERVFDYAEGANYGDFWVTTEAKDLYVF